MPLNRYQIRNEYSLADPELYKAADKDDPEALLEGVAMAGLVGVLRQLGDLAEFAAEIFHDLHEEVMATAARGHSLTVRVQQLEAEFPLIEREFLSQTNHSSFFYNAGTDWHPNPRIGQNMVTSGDLPRFVMDSYEECRGPPRLFLLDKFDVAGAGACLKRYTDPSSFKVETSSYSFTTSDVQREKKTRKSKKRGSRWRNGETPEVLPTSHAKLHQLFLEERIENGINVPAHRVKLKRKLNGFPFDPKTGKSYMNKFLEATSPEHRVVHEIGIDSSPLRLTSTDAYETSMDTEDIRPPSPDKEVMRRNKSASSSPSPPQSEESNALKPCLDEVVEDLYHDQIRAISRPNDTLQSTDLLPSTHSMVDEKEIAMDGESRTEGSVGYESDDVASEIDNYVDALTTMESELETDSEQRAKKDLHFLNSKNQVLLLSSSSEKLQTQSSDSHSMGNSTLSDDGNSYSKKEISSFSCSDSPSTSVESVLLESEISSKEAKTSDISYDRQSVNEETQLPQPPEHGDYDKRCIMVAREHSGSCDSVAGMRAETSEKFVAHGKSENPLTSIAEDAADLHASPPRAPIIFNAPERNGDNSPSRASIEDKLADDSMDGNLNVGENVSCASNPSDVPRRASGILPWSKSPKVQRKSKLDNDADLHVSPPCAPVIFNAPEQNEDDSPSRVSIEDKLAHDSVDGNLSVGENVFRASNPSDVPRRATGKLPWSKSPKIQHESKLDNDDMNLQLHNLDREDPLLGEDLTCLYNLSDGPSKEGDTSPSSSSLAVNHPNHLNGLGNENSNGISEGSVQKLDILGAPDKECGKHSWYTMSHDKTAEDTYMKKPHNLTTTEIEDGDADGEHEETCGAFSDAVTSEPGDISKNCGVDGLDFFDALNPQIPEIANDIQPLESGKVEISCSKQENYDEVSSMTKFEEKDSIVPSELLYASASTGSITSQHLESLIKEAILSDETEHKIDKSDVTVETASLAALAYKEDIDDLHSSLDQKRFSEESVCLIGHSSQNDLETDLPDGLVESKFEIQIADSPDSNSFVHDASNYHHPESEVLDTLSDNKLSFDAENILESNTASSQSPLSLDTEQVSSQGKNVVDSTEDASSLQTISLEEGKDELKDDQLNEELLDNDVLSPLMEQMQPSSHVDRASDASSLSLLPNLPSQDAEPDVIAHSSNQDPQPLLTDNCAEERAESAIHEHDKMEVLDNGESKSEPLALLAQPQQVDSFDLEQSAESSSIASPTFSPRQPSFPELLSQSNQDSLTSFPIHHSDKKEDEIPCKEPDEEKLIDEGATKEELLPQFEEARLSNHADIVGAVSASSIPFMANVPCQTSVSNPLPLSSHNVNPFEHGNTMISTSPGFVLLPGEPQIDLAEMPPLPPLPPIQWRMGKLHSSPDLDEELTQHHIGANSSSLPPRTDQNDQPVNRNMALSAVATESTALSCGNSSRFIDPGDKHSINPHFPLPGQYHEVQQSSLHAMRGGETQPVNSISDVTSLDKPSTDALGSSEELIQPLSRVAPEFLSDEQGYDHLEQHMPVTDGIKPKAAPINTGLTDASESLCHEPSQPQFQPQSQHHPLHQLAPETSLNRSNLEETPTRLEKNVVAHGTIIPSYTENAKPDHSIPTTEAEIIWPAVEEGNANGIRMVKLQRPRTPLIDDLAVHDKSKLRKVTERVRPEIQKDDERDSLLEQIRKKSFNLKPTVATRPSIQGPQTNLRVAAILEKAKTIRQAFAGSDEEDDEDSWSDS
ncbi:protein SCAR2 isoform X3 [Nicotiana tomentosiformis]|uniref:protein SCAR2 isoform X3 n=1 Tax=Nicotiana tomentosiformis TaxID=4098 RepID=UPI000877FDD7|nr:protein SCAR2 isoform X3 [Nicotiana tomentosiformis]